MAKHARLSSHEVSRRCKKLGLKLISKYRGSRRPFKVRCRTCSGEWVVTSLSNITNGSSCKKCFNDRRRTPQVDVATRIRHNINAELISVYTSCSDPVTLRCPDCHYEWTVNCASNVLYKQKGGYSGRCPRCHPGTRKLSQQTVVERIRINNLAKLLSKYQSHNSRLKLRCLTCEHEWEALAHDLMRKKDGRYSGCPKCNRAPKLTDDVVAHRLAGTNIVLLSKYRGLGYRVKAKCMVCSHRWRVTAASVVKHGCPTCNANQSLRSIREIFAARIKALKIRAMEPYRRSRGRLRVKCLRCGRQWRANAKNLMRGWGCKLCSDPKLTTAEVKQRCHAAGVRLLSAYKSRHEHIKVRSLRCGHTWKTDAGNIFQGSGCPVCSNHGESDREYRCRKIIEEITGQRFTKVRPKWLMGSKGRPLELDGYNRKLRVAFEHQGIQHYMPSFGEKTYLTTCCNDKIKRAICKRRGVLLICVPYWKKDIEAFLRHKLGLQRPT